MAIKYEFSKKEYSLMPIANVFMDYGRVAGVGGMGRHQEKICS